MRRPFRIVGTPLGILHPRAGLPFTLPQAWALPPNEDGVRDAVRRHPHLLPCTAWTFCRSTGAEGVRVTVYAPECHTQNCSKEKP